MERNAAPGEDVAHSNWPNGRLVPNQMVHDRCANAAVATFNYVAGTLGITGFQASAADMTVLAETRGMKHGFMILDAENLLYPQYDLPERVAAWIAKTKPRLAPVAREKLADMAGAHPDVVAHWQSIAALQPEAADV